MKGIVKLQVLSKLGFGSRTRRRKEEVRTTKTIVVDDEEAEAAAGEAHSHFLNVVCCLELNVELWPFS